jgi:hypothetical protein
MFNNCTNWTVINRFTLRDGDHLHTCVPQMVILTLRDVGARYSVSRAHAVKDDEPSVQSLSREITAECSLNDSNITVFSTETGVIGHVYGISLRILPNAPERAKSVERYRRDIGLEYTGLSAKTVPDDGLMGFEGGQLHAYDNPQTTNTWLGALGLLIPQDQFDILFEAIASAHSPMKGARIIIRANLFETEVDAALNEGERHYGLHVASGDAEAITTAAILDDFEFTKVPPLI